MLPVFKSSLARPQRFFQVLASSTAQKIQLRLLSMKTWQISQYGQIDELQLSNTARRPSISKCSDVVVKVHASSVNPIDVAMIGEHSFSYYYYYYYLLGD